MAQEGRHKIINQPQEELVRRTQHDISRKLQQRFIYTSKLHQPRLHYK